MSQVRVVVAVAVAVAAAAAAAAAAVVVVVVVAVDDAVDAVFMSSQVTGQLPPSASFPWPLSSCPASADVA